MADIRFAPANPIVPRKSGQFLLPNVGCAVRHAHLSADFRNGPVQSLLGKQQRGFFGPKRLSATKRATWSHRMQFNCPHCQQHFEADESFIDITMDCPVCGQSFVVPPPSAAYVETSQNPSDSDKHSPSPAEGRPLSTGTRKTLKPVPGALPAGAKLRAGAKALFSSHGTTTRICVIAILLALAAIWVFIACGSSQRDDAFVKNVAKGLAARWRLADSEPIVQGNPSANKNRLQKLVNAELDAVGELSDYKFKDKKLENCAETYFAALQAQKKAISLAGVNVLQFAARYNEGDNERAKAVCQLVDEYGLSVASKFEDSLEALCEKGRPLLQEDGMLQEIQALVAESVHLEAAGNDKYLIAMENTTQHDLSGIQLDFHFFDGNGVLVKTSLSSIEFFPAGQKVKNDYLYARGFETVEARATWGRALKTAYVPIEIGTGLKHNANAGGTGVAPNRTTAFVQSVLAGQPLAVHVSKFGGRVSPDFYTFSPKKGTLNELLGFESVMQRQVQYSGSANNASSLPRGNPIYLLCESPLLWNRYSVNPGNSSIFSLSPSVERFKDDPRDSASYNYFQNLLIALYGQSPLAKDPIQRCGDALLDSRRYPAPVVLTDTNPAARFLYVNEAGNPSVFEWGNREQPWFWCWEGEEALRSYAMVLRDLRQQLEECIRVAMQSKVFLPTVPVVPKTLPVIHIGRLDVGTREIADVKYEFIRTPPKLANSGNIYAIRQICTCRSGTYSCVWSWSWLNKSIDFFSRFETPSSTAKTFEPLYCFLSQQKNQFEKARQEANRSKQDHETGNKGP